MMKKSMVVGYIAVGVVFIFYSMNMNVLAEENTILTKQETDACDYFGEIAEFAARSRQTGFSKADTLLMLENFNKGKSPNEVISMMIDIAFTMPVMDTEDKKNFVIDTASEPVIRGCIRRFKKAKIISETN